MRAMAILRRSTIAANDQRKGAVTGKLH
jgi:hypothetical protein